MAGEVVLEYGGHRARAPMMDLSGSGVSVWAPESATRAPVRVTMALDDRPVVVRGHVARQFQSDGGAVWGIEFDSDPAESSMQLVIDYVDRQG